MLSRCNALLSLLSAFFYEPQYYHCSGFPICYYLKLEKTIFSGELSAVYFLFCRAKKSIRTRSLLFDTKDTFFFFLLYPRPRESEIRGFVRITFFKKILIRLKCRGRFDRKKEKFHHLPLFKIKFVTIIASLSLQFENG